MRYETILKKLKEIRSSKSGREAQNKLDKLIRQLEVYINEKQKGKIDIRHLMGWYLELWDNNPPEMLMSVNYQAVIGKHLKDLVKIYQQNGESIEQLKKDYQEFKETQKRGTKEITQFRALLPSIKRTKESKKKWTSPENERGLDYYLGEEDLSIPNVNPNNKNDEEDIPF